MVHTGPLLGAAGIGIERAKVDAGLALLAEAIAISDKAAATAACTMIKEVSTAYSIISATVGFHTRHTKGVDGMLAADQHPSLKGAAERLAQTLRELFAAYKEVVAKPGDRAALERLQRVRLPTTMVGNLSVTLRSRLWLL